jgi:cobalt-zinc-cadmium efflux system outer membrane protein
MLPSFVAGTEARAPWNAPIGVRAADKITAWRSVMAGPSFRAPGGSRRCGPKFLPRYSAATSPRGPTLLLFLAAASTACVPALPRDRAWISSEISQRTGHEIGGGDLQIGEGRPSPTARAPQSVTIEDGISEDEAVALALWNDADFQADLARLGFAKADLADAGLLPNPVFSLLFPIGPKQLELAASWALGWIWQRPHRIAVAELDATRLADELVQHGLDLVRDVRVAHADAIFAERVLELAKEAAVTWKSIAKLADKKLNAGAASRLEVGTAAADARMAQAEADRLAHDLAAAQVRLRVLTGLAEHPSALRLIPSVPSPIPDDLELLVHTALAARPDLRAAEIAIEAAGERAGWEKSKVFGLIASLDANGSGKEGFEIGPGLALEIPIFNQNQAGRSRAEAELQRASWQYVAVRRRISGEVGVARARLLEAQGALQVWPDQVLAPLEENLRLATSAYSAGGEPYVVVLEATRRLTAARRQEAELRAQVQRAAAELLRSIGGKPSAS